MDTIIRFATISGMKIGLLFPSMANLFPISISCPLSSCTNPRSLAARYVQAMGFFSLSPLLFQIK